MSFLRLRDYFSSIREQDLVVILDQLAQTTVYTPDQVRLDNELEAIAKVSAMIRHRYDVRKIFVDIKTYDNTVQYNENDLVDYSEPAYDATITYIIGDLRSFTQTVSGVTTDNIFTANTVIGTPEAFDSTKWDFVTENNSLFINRLPSLGNKPGTAFSYDSNLFTGNHDTILGWDRTNTIFLKRDDQNIKLYFSTADRTSDLNSVGIVRFNPKVKKFPGNIPITVGNDRENSVSGDLSIVGFIDDAQEWQIDPINFWEKGDNRDALIKSLVIDIAVFDIHGLINARNIPDYFGEKFERAMDILKKIQSGKISPDLPIFYDEERGQKISFGSNRKNRYVLFDQHSSLGHIDKEGDRTRTQ